MYRSAKLNVIAGAVTNALIVLIFTPGLCVAQTASSTNSATVAKAAPGDKVTSPAASGQITNPASDSDSPSTTASGSAGSGTGQVTAPAGNPPGIAGRIESFTRHVPARETWVLIRLKTDHVRAVVGGFDQGASLGFGIQFSTANLIKWVDFRATLIGSPLLYRRAEAEAYIPKVFSENTHADFWFDYLRRPQDNFYGIGPNINNGSQTNYDLEQRSYNASIEHYFTPILVAGGFFRVANSGTFKGERDSDIPIGELFSGDPNVVPATKFAPGLFSNTKILSYGAFAEYDRRDRSVGLTKGVYFYGRIGSAHGLKNPRPFPITVGWRVVSTCAATFRWEATKPHSR